MLVQTITPNATYEFAADVRAGLTKPGQKELPSKYLYDDVGSALFEVISHLPEYGLTRADERLLRRHGADIVERACRLRSPWPNSAAAAARKLARSSRLFAAASAPATIPSRFLRSALAMCERELSDIDSISILGFEREYLDGLLEVAAQRRLGQHLAGVVSRQHDRKFRSPRRYSISRRSSAHSAARRLAAARNRSGEIQLSTARGLRRRTGSDCGLQSESAGPHQS